MTIKEKYLLLHQKSVNAKNYRYLFTYCTLKANQNLTHITLFKRRNKPQNVLNIS